MNFIRNLVAIAVLLFVISATALADPVKIRDIDIVLAEVNGVNVRNCTITLDTLPTGHALEVLKNKALYQITEEPATNATAVSPQVDQVPISPTSDPDLAGTGIPVISFTISGMGYGKGHLRIDPKIAGEFVTSAKESFEWTIQKSGHASKLDIKLATQFDSKNWVGTFALSAPTRLGQAGKRELLAREGDVIRESFSFSGNVPIRVPDDIKGLGLPTEATQRTSDFLNLSYERRVYDGRHYKALSVIARTTSRGKGFEGVLNFVPITGINMKDGVFYGVDLEAGYRNGDAEWENLKKAPDSGNTVARLGAVVEFMPRFGGINADRSDGLRFFVRGRGWLDGYRETAGRFGGRFRYFVDAELFYTFSSKYRVFLRGEEGYMPPDLSNRVRRVFVGVGAAF